MAAQESCIQTRTIPVCAVDSAVSQPRLKIITRASVEHTDVSQWSDLAVVHAGEYPRAIHHAGTIAEDQQTMLDY